MLVLNSVRYLQNIHHQATRKFVFGDPLRESDPDFRLSYSLETWIPTLALHVFCSLLCEVWSMDQQHYLGAG